MHIVKTKPDPDDNVILECAITANAKIIVSGDSHLLDLTSWENIKIISPADFMNELKVTNN